MPCKQEEKELQRKEVRQWLETARYALRSLRHYEDAYYVSTNDVYDLIQAGKLVPPPKPLDPGAQRGYAQSMVFKVPYYRNTGNSVHTNNPIGKQRRVSVWEYMPEKDYRPTDTRDCADALLYEETTEDLL
jgi:hypothetical protein